MYVTGCIKTRFNHFMMTTHFKSVLLSCLILICFICPAKAQPDSGKIRVIFIGAHPDDCDETGGTAVLFAQMGYKVKFLSVTNGDAGHQTMKGKELAKRRYLEAQEAARRLGVVYDILDNHDGLLMPSLEVRMQIIKEIRDWKADIVIAPRPNDYHPDHRYTGVLVQDASYMVEVPDIAPETPALRKNPLFLYYQDNFIRPNPFRPDIAIDITNVYDKKIAGLDAHVSQMYEWLPWTGRYSDQVPLKPEDRIKWLSGIYDEPIKPAVRLTLEKWYGNEHADKVKHAEAFEICEYGSQPSDAEIKRLFPMIGK
jgi:LmbE family N-acetylglucosaminyl deacetylase